MQIVVEAADASTASLVEAGDRQRRRQGLTRLPSAGGRPSRLARVRNFASDNYAPAHPEVLAAIAEANDGHAAAYGADPWTARAEELLREHFGEQARSFLVFNGTGANVLCFRAMCRPWESVAVRRRRRTSTSTRAARRSGSPASSCTRCRPPTASSRPSSSRRGSARRGDEHAVQPRVVTVTQSSELGTRYSPGELAALADFAHEHDLLLHVDGSRLANAAGGARRAAARRRDRRRRRRAVLRRHEERPAARRGGRAAAPRARRRLRLPAQADAAARVQGRATSRRSSSRCWRATCGSETPRTPTRWPRASRARSRARPACAIVAAGAGQRRLRGDRARRDRDPAARLALLRLGRATGAVRWMCSWDTTADEVDAFAAAIAQRRARRRCARERPDARGQADPSNPGPPYVTSHSARMPIMGTWVPAIS